MATALLVGKYLQKISSIGYSGCQVRFITRGLSKKYLTSRKFTCSSRSFVARVQQQTNRADPKISRSQTPISIDNALQKLDLAVRRTGRISRKEVNDVYNELKNLGKATSTQSLLVLRCCGSLLADELPETRSELVTDVWDTLQTFGVQLDVSHYNALLKVYLENEYEFSPTDFLAEMEKKGIQPNRVTYQRLIEHYCYLGDIEGAGKILECMKQQNLPVNEKVFNALITGHARANDLVSARGVIDLMKNAKLEPSAESYTTLINAFAEKGDIKTIREILQEAEKNQVNFINENYLAIAYSLAKNGHTEHVDEIFEKLHRTSYGFVSECIITIYKLINCNQEDIAFKLLKLLPLSSKQTGEAVPVGNFFLRHLVRMEKSPDKIIEICNELKRLNLNSGALLKATECSLFLGKEHHAETFLKLLKEENFPIRCHYFWPIFCAYKKKNDSAKILETVKLMQEMGAPANYSTFVDYVYPNLAIQDSSYVIETLKSFEYTTGEIVGPLIEHFVREDDMTEANNLLDKYAIRLNPSSMISSLANAYKETEDLPATLKFLKRIKESASKELSRISKIDWTGVFLLDCIRNCSRAPEKIMPLLQGLLDEELFISQGTLEIIKTRVWASAPPEICSMLEKLAILTLDVPQEGAESTMVSHPRDMPVDELESHLIELKSKNMNTRGVLRRLLLRHAQKKNLKRVEEIMSELDQDEFVYSPAMMAQLLDLYTYSNDLEKASKYFNDIRQTQPDFSLDTHKLINYAALLVKEDKFDDAFKILSENQMQLNKESGKYLEGNIWRLLNAAADKNTELPQKLFDLVLNNGYCKPSNVILGPLIKAYLLKDDVPGAVVKFEELSQTYSCTPWRNELFVRLINLEDAEKLQKVVDINNRIHGEANTLHDLAFSFLICHRYKEARKVLETPGLRAKQGRLDQMCERLLEEDKVEELEQLTKITEDLFDVNRDRLFLFLIRAYYKMKDPKRALGVWTAMQEENVLPSDETLIYLGKFLQEYNEAVPFIMPEEKQILKITVNDQVQKGNVDSALETRRQLEASGKQLNIAESSALIETLIHKGRLTEALNITIEMLDRNSHPEPKVFRYLVNQIAQSGDVEAIKSLEPKLSLRQKRIIRYNNLIFQVYISSNRHMEFLENLEKNVEGTVNSCPSGAFLSLLEKFPELCDRVHKLAQEYIKYEHHGVLNYLWAHYFINENYEKAERIFKENPRFQTALEFRSILNSAEKSSNEGSCLRLLDLIKSTKLPYQSLGRIYNSLIEIQCNMSNFTKAAEYVEMAAKDNVDSFLFARTLTKLASGLEREGKNVPFQIKKDTTSKSKEANSDSDDDRK